ARGSGDGVQGGGARGALMPRSRGLTAARTCAAAALGGSAACAGPQSALDPAGPAAERIGTLTWILFAFGGAVTLLVVAVLALAIRRDPSEDASASAPLGRSPEARALRWVLLGGAALPAAAIVPLFFYSVLLHGWIETPAEPALT